MRDELYIDGTKVDMGGSGVSLEYRSNILTDISKVVSNFSYTIRLPKTKNNLRLIECAHIPSAVSSFPYLPHVGTLLRDGVQIVEDANVVLISVSDTIEIALSWGNAVGFAKIVDNDKTLQDLNYETGNNAEYIYWTLRGNPTLDFPEIRYGFKENETAVYNHPVVSAKWILDKISSDSGVTFNFPKTKEDMLETMIIPILLRDDSPKLIEENAVMVYVSGLNVVTQDLIKTATFLFASGSGRSFYMELVKDSEPMYKYVMPLYKDLKLKITLDCYFVISVEGIEPGRALQVFNNETGEVIETYQPDIVEDLGNNLYKIIYNSEYEITDIPELNKLSFFFNSRASSEFSGWGGTIKFSFSSSIIAIGEYLVNRYYYVPNLPNIKQIDFIKSVAYMLGVFAVPGKGNAIDFVSFDSVIENKKKAVDWSGKVVFGEYGDVARNISYQLNDFAQRNWFRYKEDDTVKGNYDSYIPVENRAIEYERDAVSLPFAACDSYGNVAVIPLYSYNDDGELEYDSGVEPRIVLYDPETKSGRFYPLAWSELVKQNYSSYREVVKQPKVVKELVRLSPPELAELDLLTPVYIRQYGSYFAIVTVKTKENNICEVELLKI